MVFAYAYVATTVDDSAKLVRPFGTQQTLADLRSQEPVLKEIDRVDVTLGACHDQIVEKVGAISGVEQVEMFDPRESDDEGDPLDSSFLVTRAADGDWGEIMPAVGGVLAELLGVAPEEVVLSDYTYHDVDA
jgi:hypothetical protein